MSTSDPEEELLKDLYADFGDSDDESTTSAAMAATPTTAPARRRPFHYGLFYSNFNQAFEYLPDLSVSHSHAEVYFATIYIFSFVFLCWSNQR